MMSMPDGTRWATVTEAARMHRVRADTIYKWVRRQDVRSHPLRGRLYVCLDDVSDAELRWRRRVAGQTAQSRPQ